MAPYQQRVVDEKKDLDERLAKLKAFVLTEVYRNLPADEQDRLSRQYDAMYSYSCILGERIAAFPAE